MSRLLAGAVVTTHGNTATGGVAVSGLLAVCPECSQVFDSQDYQSLGQWSKALDWHAEGAGCELPERVEEDTVEEMTEG